MRTFVAVVICVVSVPPAAGAARHPPALASASRLSGLQVRAPVRTLIESGARFETDAARALDRNYPESLQRLDHVFYAALGLEPAARAIRGTLRDQPAASRALYDASTRTVRLRRAPAPRRTEVIDAYVRALVDQNFGLQRLSGLRSRDRDGFLAASGLVDGVASLASGSGAAPLPAAPPITRFLAVERSAGLAAGRNLAANLRYLGGTFAVGTALRTFPQTTEQLLHLDKFLERERALPVPLLPSIANVQLGASETFGELDVRALLRAFDLPGANAVAAGWGGGRLALYVDGSGAPTVALVFAGTVRMTRESGTRSHRGSSEPHSRPWPRALARRSITVGRTAPVSSHSQHTDLSRCWGRVRKASSSRPRCRTEAGLSSSSRA